MAKSEFVYIVANSYTKRSPWCVAHILYGIVSRHKTEALAQKRCEWANGLVIADRISVTK